MMFKDLEKHQTTKCPCARVKCPNSKANGGWGCTLQLRRRNLAAHLLECVDPSIAKEEVKVDESVLKKQQSPPSSPGMTGRRAKQDLPVLNTGPSGSGLRVRIPLRSSKAGRKLMRKSSKKRG
jgi:hypothetical protein